MGDYVESHRDAKEAKKQKEVAQEEARRVMQYYQYSDSSEPATATEKAEAVPKKNTPQIRSGIKPPQELIQKDHDSFKARGVTDEQARQFFAENGKQPK